MPFYNVIIIIIVSSLLWCRPVAAEMQLFSGNLEVVTTSGKACTGHTGIHEIFLVFGSDGSHDEVFGYVGGESVIVGQIRGSLRQPLKLRYPYPDAERAEGHTLRIVIMGASVTGELRDRHIDAAVDDCNVDLARLSLVRNDNNEVASETYQRLSLQYEAQMIRATAMAFSKKGLHAESSQSFEKALTLADRLYPAGSARLIPYLTGLANSYMRAGRYQDFSALYTSRFTSLHDDAVKMIFSHHEIRSLLQVGRAAMGREDYRTALYNFRQALKIDYKNRDAIAATMSALVRSGQHDEAITFLEETEQKLDNEPDKRDVREAIALVTYRKAKKEQQAGRGVDAERLLNKAIKLDPVTVQYVVELARMIHKTGRYAEADTLLRRGIDSSKDETRRKDLMEAREKLRQTEMILTKIRKAGS